MFCGMSFDSVATVLSSKSFFFSATSRTKKLPTSSPAGMLIFAGVISLTMVILDISASIFSFAAVFIWNFA